MSSFEQLVLSAFGTRNNEPMLISPTFVENYFKSIFNYQTSTPPTFKSVVENLSSAYGRNLWQEDKDFAFSNGVAIIPISGMLLNRFGGSWGFVTGYQAIRRQLNSAMADRDVNGILFDVNSGGGEAAGMFELADEIVAAGKIKPTKAIVDAHAYSAAYGLASAANSITIARSGGVGSIGVVSVHADFSKMLESDGITVTMIYAGKHKVDGNPYQALSKTVKDKFQQRVDELYSEFVNAVASNRKMDSNAVRETEAATFSATEGLRIGLVDAVEAPKDAFSAFLTALSGAKKTQEGFAMSDPAKAPGATVTPTAEAPDLNAVRSEGANAERKRVGDILNCEQAKGRESLANHFAFNTSISVEDAKAALAAAPVAQQTAAAKTPFDSAMEKDNPNLSATPPKDERNDNKADAILRDFAAATGNKYAAN